MNQDDLRQKILETARAIGANPVDLATAISFESGFNPNVWGGSGGNYFGLIQFGPNERKQYGVDTSNPDSQLGANGAIANYMRDRGFKPGMSGMDLYSTINAGSPGRYGASDAANGGTPGDVRNKWENQMSGHRQKAEQLLGANLSPEAQDFVNNNPQPGGFGPGIADPNSPPVFGSMSPGSGGGQMVQNNGIPQFVADHWSGLDDGSQKQNPLEKAGAALTAAAKEYPAPGINGAFGGDARQSGDLLMKALQNPQALAQLLMKQRMV